MTKIKLSIKNRFTGSIIFEYEKENNTIKETVLKAIEDKINLRSADLRYANLRYANLRYANLRSADLSSANLRYANLSSANLSSADLSSADLRYADLSYANLSSADLSSADLSYANLRYADLSSADLRYADLSSIKTDVFYVLLKGKEEIAFLKKNIIEGKIDGSTYDGECACLSGTLEHGAKITNGVTETVKVASILSCRQPSRPAERFFLGIKKGDTPGNNQVSAIVLSWIEEFESLINR
jgi:uncharacterized protein YjbI with pentapeptide repeats